MRPAVIVWALAVAGLVPAIAQDEPVPSLAPGDTVILPVPDPLRKASQLKREEMLRYMELQIGDLHHQCHLDGGQTARLRTAAKGAVELALQQWIKTVEEEGWIEMMNQMDAASADQWLATASGPTAHRTVPRQEIWKNAVDSVLTESQKERRAFAEAERRTFRRQAALNQAIAILEMELFLTRDQRESIGKLIDEELGERFGKNGRAPRTATQYAELLPKEKLEKILNEKQLARWNDVLLQAGMAEHPEAAP